MSDRRKSAQLDREIAVTRAAQESGAGRVSYTDRRDPLSTAAEVVTDRVRASEAYRLGRLEVVRASVEAVGPSPTADRLRALGGLTKVVNDQVDNVEVPGLDANLGSPMFPHTPRSQLHREVGALRAEVQQLLAAQGLT